MTDRCVYSYNADGTVRCIVGNQELYDFTVMLMNPITGDVLTEYPMTGVHIKQDSSGMMHLMRLPPFPKPNTTARVVIVDSTVYNDASKKSLRVFVSFSDNMRPTQISFSSIVTLANFHNRTASLDIKDYNGASLYVA